MQTSSFARRHRFLRHVIGRPRLLFCVLLGFGVAFGLPQIWRLETRLLIAWNIGVLAYIATSAQLMFSATQATIKRQARLTDESRFIVLTLTCLAAVASLFAIIAQLAQVKTMEGLDKQLHLGLAALTIISSWAFIHIIFTQHYAHEYFIERASERELPENMRGGICFPDTTTPDFSDFLYFSFVIGVACQTADVSICSRPMRRVALAHCVLSFFFNTTVLALTINIASGLI